MRSLGPLSIIVYALPHAVSLDFSKLSTTNHILLDVRQRVQIAIHVRPSGVFRLLLGLVVVASSMVHVGSLVLESNLVVQLLLGVGQVLDGPLLVLVSLRLVQTLLLNGLRVSLNIDALNLLRLETLEVVRHVTVRGQLGHGGARVLGHDVAHVRAGDLVAVLGLLVVLPGVLAVSLLLSEALVVRLELGELLLLAVGHLVLEHASHASHVVGLGGVFGLLVLEAIVDGLLLSGLLRDPLLLGTSVLVLAVSEVYRREDHGSKNALVLVEQIEWDGVKQK